MFIRICNHGGSHLGTTAEANLLAAVSTANQEQGIITIHIKISQ